MNGKAHKVQLKSKIVVPADVLLAHEHCLARGISSSKNMSLLKIVISSNAGQVLYRLLHNLPLFRKASDLLIPFPSSTKARVREGNFDTGVPSSLLKPIDRLETMESHPGYTLSVISQDNLTESRTSRSGMA
ncbi:Uncharacterized protein Adt_37610 [Abeliophyllum distichum]|uniref:Uncharacterized protein n=1 Tax=Abeliophyllum distichum TaxID=126358 RepID=A0ABD1PZV3_9LAMI